MSISLYLASIRDAEKLIVDLLIKEFVINEKRSKFLYEKRVKPHLEKLKSNIYLVVESNYVDKVYRDSYYHYYSSKLRNYKRDCIRISLFENEVTEENFRSNNTQEELQSKYRGFIVLRPTDPFIIGRSIISPKALDLNNFLSCTSKFNTTANGVKFYVDAFPHSSQDTETISCAETTLWAVMEYFSNKYSDYRPVLPSKIIDTLHSVSSERQTPSKGLNIAQMSYALREFGFGTRVYSKDEYPQEFENLLSCYIESGVPLIIAMENRPSGNIGHALLAVGHEKVTDEMIDEIPSYTIPNSTLRDSAASKNIIINDFAEIKKDFIFIDDNRPAYQRATLDLPAHHYPAVWHNCKITYFIVPLYTKIYLEAFEAKNYVLNFLINGPVPLLNNSHILLRFYLASSRSFKNEIAKNETLQEDVKAFLLETSMPKFIWVTEISSKELIKQNKASGLIILDATEANIYFNKPLLIAAYQGNFIIVDEDSGKLENALLDLHEFRIFNHNLNAFNND